MSDFKAKMHQNPKFDWGSAPDPRWGAYSAPPVTLAGFKGATSKGSKGRGWDGRGGECCGVQQILKIDLDLRQCGSNDVQSPL